jgi:two-component system cell cycle sensor histidine kinase/response regulator CckA
VDPTEAARLGGIPAGDYVTIAVSDTGPGMTEEVRAHVFDPFRSAPKNSPGLGLGLAIVEGIVKQSGGVISVQSAPGEGTTFRIYLPRAEAEAKVSAPAAPAVLSSPVPTVLLVEDEAPLRQLAAQVLLNVGLAVLEAEDGIRALQVAGRFPGVIDLVMTGMEMPGMGGRDLVRRLMETRPDIKVLYTSGRGAHRPAEGAPSPREVAFLPKPFTMDGLTGAVRELLDTRRAA